MSYNIFRQHMQEYETMLNRTVHLTTNCINSINDPIETIVPTGMGPENRVKVAYGMIDTEYLQETNTKLRTEDTAEALKYMDCAEFVCRVLAADNITIGVIHLTTSGIKNLLDDKTKFDFSEDKPRVGDIAVWNGHVGIVTGVDGTKIKLTHARGKGKLAQENPYAIDPEKYRPGATFYGYYRPKNEVKSEVNPIVKNEKADSSSSLPEPTYNGGTLPEVVVIGNRNTAPKPIQISPPAPIQVDITTMRNNIQ